MARIADIADYVGIILVIIIFFKGFDLDRKVHIYIYIYIFSLVFKNLLTLFMSYKGIYNIYVYNWYSIIGYIIIALLYRVELKNKYVRIAILISIGVVVGLLYIDPKSFFDTRVIYFSRYSHNLVDALAIVIILIYFIILFKIYPPPIWLNTPYFGLVQGHYCIIQALFSPTYLLVVHLIIVPQIEICIGRLKQV